MKNILNAINFLDLSGKIVAITGATGGLGTAICRYLAAANASLVLLNRNMERSNALAQSLQAEFPSVCVEHIPLDLADLQSVQDACVQLESLSPDILIHNAGAYKIKRYTCSTDLDNVFQINFASPYYITKELLPLLRKKKGKIIAVSSIAHRYAVSDPTDVDFKRRKASHLAYGNAKRYLTFSLFELFKEEKDVSLAVVHPGITFTNITNHFPPLIFALIKHPMKWIFMKPQAAARCILAGIVETCKYHEWIGPRLFDIWGNPCKRKISAKSAECEQIFKAAETIYENEKEG